MDNNNTLKELCHLTWRAAMDSDTTIEQCLEWHNIVATKLQALEIIKEKISDINWFRCCDSLEDYNGSVPSYKHLTQEEYEILRKVLL